MMTFDFLLPDRETKPRETGITMVLDKGLGYEYAKDLMEISGNYVDLMKFGWGTAIIQNKNIISKKIKMYQSYDIIPYTGGTLFEIAYINDKIEELLKETKELGFTAIEISDGSTDMKREEKLDFISIAKEEGFYVLSEVGKKDLEEDNKVDLKSRIQYIKEELKVGSDKVIIEARESGKGIGIFDNDGNAKTDEIDQIIQKIDNNNLIWEAPNKNQQVYFVKKLGTNVNLGNISTNDIISIETIRRGLRGDTIDLLKRFNKS
ncbi:MAG: phosphosulfolactate synthase [Methanobrevibacter sp.]|nr:phosphosulfolactate synthase [Methanobrevibacter sp.]